MPGMNGTGPMGQGPLTGGGRGPCGRGLARGYGYGRGMGQGYGRGFGRGLAFGGRAWPQAEYQGSSLTEMEERLARLEAENQDLKDRLKQQS